MVNSPIQRLSLLSLISLSLASCGGGGGSSSTTNPTPDPTPNTPNVAPTAQITNQPETAILGLQPYTLSGATSSDSDGSIVSYQWSQINGQPVTLGATNQSDLTFSPLNINDTVTFELTVTDNDGDSDRHQVSLETRTYFKEFTMTRGESCTITFDGTKDVLSCWYPQYQVDTFNQLHTIVNPRNLVSGPYLTCVESDEGVKCFGQDAYSLYNHLPELTTTEGLILSGPLACQLSNNNLECWHNSSFGSDVLNIPQLTNPVQVAASDRAVCILDQTTENNAEVKCITMMSYLETTVPELSNPTQLFASTDNGLCATDDNGLTCWTPETLEAGAAPVIWPQLTDITDVAINDDYICYTRESNSQIECQTINDQEVVPAFTQLDNIQNLHLAHLYGCALDNRGIACWSDRFSNQLTPPSFDQVISINNGELGSCAIGMTDQNKHLQCWGKIPQHQYALDLTTLTFDQISYVSLNISGTCLVDNNGPRCFGYDSFYGSGEGEIALPTHWTNVSEIEWSADSVCALMAGSIDCFTDWDYYGNTHVPPLTNVSEFAAADTFNCAIDDAGLHCWGMQDWHITDFEIPVPNLSNPTGLSATEVRACAISQGQVHCWGKDDAASYPPVTISNATKVSAGFDHSCAIDDNGVICWGLNKNGQLEVPALSNPTDVIANKHYSCATDDTGIVCWGLKGFLDSRITSVDQL